MIEKYPDDAPDKMTGEAEAQGWSFDLIEAQDGDMISIAGGCICCSFGND